MKKKIDSEIRYLHSCGCMNKAKGTYKIHKRPLQDGTLYNGRICNNHKLGIVVARFPRCVDCGVELGKSKALKGKYKIRCDKHKKKQKSLIQGIYYHNKGIGKVKTKPFKVKNVNRKNPFECGMFPVCGDCILPMVKCHAFKKAC